MDLPRYKLESKCVKCGHDMAYTRHWGTIGGTFSVLRRTCCRCEYEWFELPLDAPEPDGSR